MLNFEGLNKAQLQAVTSTDPVILTLAGAGSGKTTVLTKRIANLHINHRVGTSNMLALTFTRLAGKEMKERIMKLVGENQGKNLFCNTFHAFAVRVLRRWGQRLGIDENFTIYDQEDRAEIIKAIIKDFGNKTTLNKALERFDRCKDVNIEKQLSPEECRVLIEYGYRLRQNNAVDLDRLIDLVNKLWHENYDVLKVYQREYTHLFVDEFQDTNDEQMEMIRLLSPLNLFVVGDDFQAIYGWRGAKVGYILDFSSQYPDCQVIKLEENYRSTEPIIAAANQLIKHNIKQTQKKLNAQKAGDAIVFDTYEDEWDEARSITKRVRDMIDCGKRPKDIVVLSRTNAQVDRLKNLMDQFYIPAQRVGGGNDPLKKRDVKLLLTWLDVYLNRMNSNGLRRILNFPRSLVNPIQLQQLELEALKDDLALYDVLVRHRHPFIEDIRRLDQIVTDSEAFTPPQCFKALMVALNLKEMYSQRGLENRKRDIEAAYASMIRWEASKQALGEDCSLGSFLRFLRYRDIQEKLIEQQDAVNLMTIHAAKGLEFDTVIITGLNQGTFPSRRAADLEEERRLFYVAVTRAKNRLILTRSDMDSDYSGNPVKRMPSQFLSECLD